jgi:hypothetical protein
MLTDYDLSQQIKILHAERAHLPQDERGDGAPLTWVIGEDVLYAAALNRETALMFLEHDEALDVSSEHPDHDGITVQFKKDGQVINELQTTEFFGSILLSNPKVINLKGHKRGQYIEVPAKFINNEFFSLNEAINELPEVWDDFATHDGDECLAELCQCKK